MRWLHAAVFTFAFVLTTADQMHGQTCQYNCPLHPNCVGTDVNCDQNFCYTLPASATISCNAVTVIYAPSSPRYATTGGTQQYSRVNNVLCKTTTNCYTTFSRNPSTCVVTPTKRYCDKLNLNDQCASCGPAGVPTVFNVAYSDTCSACGS